MSLLGSAAPRVASPNDYTPSPLALRQLDLYVESRIKEHLRSKQHLTLEKPSVTDPVAAAVQLAEQAADQVVRLEFNLISLAFNLINEAFANTMKSEAITVAYCSIENKYVKHIEEVVELYLKTEVAKVLGDTV